jgi:chorismate dehydratase
MTGLPFVFACWVSNKKIEDDFISEFNESLKTGVTNMDKAIDKESVNYPHCLNPVDYLNHKISYNLDTKKRRGMELFLTKVTQNKQ